MSKNDPQDRSSAQPGFEEAMQRLEEIVGQLEAGQLGLEQALARYEEGVKLLRHCYGLLQRAERRIELLTGVDANGRPLTKPFDASATLPPEQIDLPTGGQSGADDNLANSASDDAAEDR